MSTENELEKSETIQESPQVEETAAEEPRATHRAHWQHGGAWAQCETDHRCAGGGERPR